MCWPGVTNEPLPPTPAWQFFFLIFLYINMFTKFVLTPLKYIFEHLDYKFCLNLAKINLNMIILMLFSQ